MAAIESFAGDIGLDVRAALNPLISTRLKSPLRLNRRRPAMSPGNQALDLALDGLSLASIYFLAAIGLAITFGVMGVINMAHGEFIMMGAYTGYVVQLFVPDYTLSILIALPLAFAVTFGRGGDGAAGDPLALSPPAGNAAGHLRHFHRAAADRQEHLRHAGAPADRSPDWLTARGCSTTWCRSATSASRSSCSR
jgi:hypothetical protein